MPWHWPGYNYLGPGTNRFDRPAKNRLDAAARRHDKRYYRYGKKAYFYYNKADEEFVKTAEKIPGVASAVSRGVFKLKKMIAPSLPEKNSDDMAKRSRSRGRSRTPKRLRFSPGTSTPRASRSRSASVAPSARSASRSRSTYSSWSGASSASRRSSSSQQSSGGKGLLGKVKTYRSRSAKKGGFNYNKFGIVSKVEAGSTLTDTQCVYVGHTTCPAIQLLKQIYYAFAKMVFVKLGVDVDNAQETQIVQAGGNTVLFDVTLKLSPALNANAYTTTTREVLTGLTIQTAGQQFLDHIKTAVGTTTDVEFLKFNFYRQVTLSGSSSSLPLFEIDLRQCMFKMHCTSLLKIQNSTYANLNPADPNATSTEDIENNPLIGYLYKKSTWANYLEIKGISGKAPVPLMTGDATHGALQFQGATANAEDLNVFIKPPTKAYQMGCNSQASVKVAPGDILSSALDFKVQKIGFNRLMKLLADMIRSNTNNHQIEMGKAAIFSLEKMIQSFQVNVAPIRIAWQIDNVFRIAALQRRNTFTADTTVVIGA